MINNYQYQIGGSLPVNASSYVKRQADEELYQGIKAGNFCYVLNSRQMGKSSLRVRTTQRLRKEGILCVGIDMTEIGTWEITPSQWYAGIIDSIVYGLNLDDIFDIDDWWLTYSQLSDVKKFRKFIENFLLKKVEKQIVIFVDEIDSTLSLPFSVDDFFATIRDCYNQRAEKPEYQRITFVLIGVATPSDLIRDKRRTSFNIGMAVELTGFKIDEVQPLTIGLAGKVTNPRAVMSEVLDWTGGQPFLTQKVCKLILKAELIDGNEANFIEKLVTDKIIKNWELHDQPEHLKTIEYRLLVNEKTTNRLLGIYQQILHRGEIDTDDSPEQTQLRLSGLAIKQGNKLTVYNRICQEVFNQKWVEKELDKLRPYSEAITAWLASDGEDKSRLLRGQALQDAQTWATNKNLSDKDYKFLAASQKNELKEEKQRAQSEINKVLQQQLKIAIFSSIAMTTLAILTGFLWVKSFIGERKIQLDLLSITSEALFESDRGLDALITEIKAGKQLKKSLAVGADTRMRVIMALHQGVYLSKENNRLGGHKSTIIKGDFNPAGTFIASASDDGTVKLWNTQGKLLQTFKDHDAQVRSISFHPNYNLLASGSHDKTIKLWSFDGQLLQTLVGHQHKVRDVSFSPNGNILASASADGTVILWNEDGKQLQTLGGHSGWVEVITFSPDGQILASGATDKTIKLWHPENGQLLQTLEGNIGSIQSLSFSSDGQLLASAGVYGIIKLWSRQGKKWELFQTIEGHKARIEGISFSPDGKTLASASYDNTVKLWNLDGKLLEVFRGHNAPVYDVSFSPTENILASAGADEAIILWNPKSRLKPLVGHNSFVYNLKFSPDGQRLYSASRHKIIKVWRTKDGKLLSTRSGSLPKSSTISPDGRMKAVAVDDKVKIFNEKEKLLLTLKGHSAEVTDVKFSPDNQRIATASIDGTVKIWQTNGILLYTLRHKGRVNSIDFAFGGRILVSGSADKMLRLWHFDGTLLKTLRTHQANILSVSFSPNGQILASADSDGKIILWNLNLDDLLIQGCNLLHDYLNNNPDISQGDRHLCD